VKRLLVLPAIVAIQACASGTPSPNVREIPSGWPVAHGTITVTAEFGEKRDGRRHQGIDLAAPSGTEVHAAAAGRVVFAGKDGRYGKTVVIDHGGGWRTRYAHLKRIDVHHGQRVRGGVIVGRVGKSGNATGPHLHYEVMKNGVPVDPRPFLD
jgi:murein DD-endopeptidase MepM/ murein hydrolase activator NlpD